MLRALGFRFPDKTGNVSGYGGQMMGKVDSIDTSSVHPLLSGCTFTAACDVRNPFYGTTERHTYSARQKGADAAMIEALDAGMRHLAAVIFRTTGKVYLPVPEQEQPAEWAEVCRHSSMPN